jgi:hypothetical protein
MDIGSQGILFYTIDFKDANHVKMPIKGIVDA